MEMLASKADVFLKTRASENDFWKLTNSKYCYIKKSAVNMRLCFSSTYSCESAFSFMNKIKTKQLANRMPLA